MLSLGSCMNLFIRFLSLSENSIHLITILIIHYKLFHMKIVFFYETFTLVWYSHIAIELDLFLNSNSPLFCNQCGLPRGTRPKNSLLLHRQMFEGKSSYDWAGAGVGGQRRGVRGDQTGKEGELVLISLYAQLRPRFNRIVCVIVLSAQRPAAQTHQLLHQMLRVSRRLAFGRCVIK